MPLQLPVDEGCDCIRFEEVSFGETDLGKAVSDWIDEIKKESKHE